MIPDAASLWTTLGLAALNQGQVDAALACFDQALRLVPLFHKARYHRARALYAAGRAAEALQDCDAVIERVVEPSERADALMLRAMLLLAQGRLDEGWPAYQARLSPDVTGAVDVRVEARPWTPGDDLVGRRLLLVGEQGSADEILFGGVLPDVLESLGPNGRLILAVEARLVPLFARAFPSARVGAHQTAVRDGRPVRTAPFAENDAIDLWAPMASLLGLYRATIDRFPRAMRLFKPDPDRVGHWRSVLAAIGRGPKVGVLWKSPSSADDPEPPGAPFADWCAILDNPDLIFISLQLGAGNAELRLAKRNGVALRQLPGIDLLRDLEEVAALCGALDLVIGPANATTHLAAACGIPVWLVCAPGAWRRLGREHYPWYSQVRVFDSRQSWADALDGVGKALADWR
jgi:tetratricopeptide (TPR) repeat protein